MGWHGFARSRERDGGSGERFWLKTGRWIVSCRLAWVWSRQGAEQWFSGKGEDGVQKTVSAIRCAAVGAFREKRG